MVPQTKWAKCCLIVSATMCAVLAGSSNFENRASKQRHSLFDTLINLRAQKSTQPTFLNVTLPPDPIPDSIDAQSELLQQLQTESEQEESNDDLAMNREGSAFLKKPTKYHYYPHNQHLYLLPECATQQVCNAVYTRLNYTQPLCACPDRFSTPCSGSLATNDRHTLQLGLSQPSSKKTVTLIKTCESISQIRECRAPQDWALLALQNVRTGKSQFLVICRCPERHNLGAYEPRPACVRARTRDPCVRHDVQCTTSSHVPPTTLSIQTYPRKYHRQCFYTQETEPTLENLKYALDLFRNTVTNPTFVRFAGVSVADGVRFCSESKMGLKLQAK